MIKEYIMQYSFILFQIKLLFLRFLYILIIFLTQKYNIQNIFKLSFTHIDRFDILRCCSFRLFSHNSLRNTRIMHTHTRCWNTISDHVFRTKLFENYPGHFPRGEHAPPLPPFFFKEPSVYRYVLERPSSSETCHHNVSCAPLISFESIHRLASW